MSAINTNETDTVSTKDTMTLKSSTVSKGDSEESQIDTTKKDIASTKGPVLLKHLTALSKVLSSQDLAVVKTATKPPKTSAQVLTSSENLKILEHKETEKKKLRRKGTVRKKRKEDKQKEKNLK